MGAGDWIGDCNTETGKAQQDDDEMNGEKKSNPRAVEISVRVVCCSQQTNCLAYGHGGGGDLAGSRPPLPVSLSHRWRATPSLASPPRDFSHSVASSIFYFTFFISCCIVCLRKSPTTHTRNTFAFFSPPLLR